MLPQVSIKALNVSVLTIEIDGHLDECLKKSSEAFSMPLIRQMMIPNYSHLLPLVPKRRMSSYLGMDSFLIACTLDTVMLNQLNSFFRGGYVHTVHTSDLFNLNFPPKSPDLEEYILHKIGLITTASVLAITSTTLVHFTLRETHVRVLRFTVQMRQQSRQGAPLLMLMAAHSVESLAFLPIMVGVLMFLFEFFEDQELAFLVFSVVWMCEIFGMVWVRGDARMRLFPRFFFALFLLFLIYLYSFPLGFCYVAFVCWFLAVLSVMLYFLNHIAVTPSSVMQGTLVTTTTIFWT